MAPLENHQVCVSPAWALVLICACMFTGRKHQQQQEVLEQNRCQKLGLSSQAVSADAHRQLWMVGTCLLIWHRPHNYAHQRTCDGTQTTKTSFLAFLAFVLACSLAGHSRPRTSRKPWQRRGAAGRNTEYCQPTHIFFEVHAHLATEWLGMGGRTSQMAFAL